MNGRGRGKGVFSSEVCGVMCGEKKKQIDTCEMCRAISGAHLWVSTPSMFPDHVILTKILGSRSRKKKGVWGAFLGVFVDRIVRFGAIAESDGVILEKWTKFY